MNKDLENRLQDFRKSISEAAEQAVYITFPEKIISLTELLASSSPDSLFQTPAPPTDTTVYPPPSEISSNEPQNKKRKLSAGTNGMDTDSTSTTTAGNDSSHAYLPNRVASNQYVVKLHEMVKAEAEELGVLVDTVKHWVTLTMPKIEDGDNFGVGVQEEVLGELIRAQENARTIRDSARQDYLSRAKICSKLIKYPHIEDYTLALKEQDEKQIHGARQHLTDIRNIYSFLTDVIHKNISKIRKPKANNSVGLY